MDTTERDISYFGEEKINPRKIVIIEYEGGRDTSVRKDVPHKLQTNNLSGRSVDTNIRFTKGFSQLPRIVVSLDKLEWRTGGKVDFGVSVAEITKKSTYLFVNFPRF